MPRRARHPAARTCCCSPYPTRYKLDRPAIELLNHANVFCREDLDIGTRAFLPQKLIVPQVLKGNTLDLEGHELDIVGLSGRQPDRTFVWIPSIKAVVGGVVVADNLHVWMADTQTPQSHKQWLATLKRIDSLQPKVVVPGHYLGDSDRSLKAVYFTRDYIKAFDEEALKARNSGELIAAMKKRYPDLGEESSLELSAKVAKGEMKW